jgi:hypothetical protein
MNGGAFTLDADDWLHAPPPEPDSPSTLTVFPIADVSGRVVAEHVRRDGLDGKRLFWRLPDGTLGLGGTPLPDLPLYRSEFVPTWPAAEPIYVCEGEKATDALTRAGAHALGTVTGAGTCPSDASLRVLAGRRVRLWADNDPAGRGHMEAVAQRLAGIAATLEFVTWPDAPEGGDAADYLEGHDVADLRALTGLEVWSARPAALRALSAHRARDPERDLSAQPRRPALDPRTEAVITLVDSIASRSVEWLWRDRIPAGMLTILDGDPGLGKSMLTLDLAARVSTGRAMAGEHGTRTPRGIVILSAEDDPARTIRPRLEAAGADLSRIAIVDVRERDGTLRNPTIAMDDLRAVEQALRQVDAALLIVDPLVAYLPDGVNANRDHDVRRALAPLGDVAERTGAAVVVVRHLRKGAAENPLYRGGGSIGIIGAARAALLVARDPDDDSGQRRILAVTKQNLAPEPPALAFTLEVPEGAEHPHLVWHGTTGHQAADLLRVPDPTDGAPERRDAEAFLLDLLAAGPLPAKQVQAEAREALLAWRTVRRAQERLGIQPRKVGRPGEPQAWLWALPEAEGGHEPPKMSISGNMATFAKSGHLRGAEVPHGRYRVDDDPQAASWLSAPIPEMPQ